jgi:hypothetical protein
MMIGFINSQKKMSVISHNGMLNLTQIVKVLLRLKSISITIRRTLTREISTQKFMDLLKKSLTQLMLDPEVMMHSFQMVLTQKHGTLIMFLVQEQVSIIVFRETNKEPQISPHTKPRLLKFPLNRV